MAGRGREQAARLDCPDFTPVSGWTSGVTVTPFTEARNRLSELVDEVERTHERVEITRHGHAVAVLISPDDLASYHRTKAPGLLGVTPIGSYTRSMRSSSSSP